MRKKLKLLNGEYNVVINNIRHWYKVGSAEKKTTPIVIIHGGPGGYNYVFERTIGPYLEQFSTIIYYEQRGCGRSDAPASETDYSIEGLVSDLKELCSYLNLQKIIPLGYSFGGELALEFAIAYPENIDKIITQGPSMFSDNKRMSNTQVNGFLRVSDRLEKKKINAIVNSKIDIEEQCSRIWAIVSTETVDKLLFKNQKFAKINRTMWTESGLVNTGHMMKALLKSNRENTLIERLNQIMSPTLIITGRYDYNVGIELNKEMAENIKKSTFVVFENSGHFPDIEESQKYADLIRRFIKT